MVEVEKMDKKTHHVPKTLEQQVSSPMKVKAWVLYIIAVIVLPCALLLCTETALRLLNIGYDPHFFCRVKNKDKVLCVDNPSFGRRFFPPTLVRTSNKLRFPLLKDKNEKRIFVLGSSAAQGDPALLKGVELVRDLFLSKLASYQVVRFRDDGAAFDPRRHEAVSIVPVTDPALDDRVVSVIRPGYSIGDDVLRPATVAVGRFTS